MKPENKALLIKYAICFVVACLITVGVFAMKGFFTDDIGVNIQILSDGFFVSGIALTIVAGLLFVSDEGALLGIGFILRSVILTFIPMGRTKHEVYAKYRERKLSEKKKSFDKCILVVGLVFLTASFVFSIIWYTKFYNSVV